MPEYNTELSKTVDYGRGNFQKQLTTGSNSSADSSRIIKHTREIIENQDLLAKKFGLEEHSDLFDAGGKPKILDFIGKDYRPSPPQGASGKKTDIEVKIKYLVAKRKGKIC